MQPQDNIIKRLKGFEIIIPDGELKGCLVYHEAVDHLIREAYAAGEQAGLKKAFDLTQKFCTLDGFRSAISKLIHPPSVGGE